MCIGSPTVRTPAPTKQEKERDPVYLRNPFLDGLGIGAENTGRNSLRIDRGSPAPNPNIPFLGIAPNPPANGPRRLPPRSGAGLGIG